MSDTIEKNEAMNENIEAEVEERDVKVQASETDCENSLTDQVDGDSTPIMKPFSMQIQTFKDNIVTVINESNIHPDVILMVMREITDTVAQLAANNKENEEKAYYSQLKDIK